MTDIAYMRKVKEIERTYEEKKLQQIQEAIDEMYFQDSDAAEKSIDEFLTSRQEDPEYLSLGNTYRDARAKRKQYSMQIQNKVGVRDVMLSTNKMLACMRTEEDLIFQIITKRMEEIAAEIEKKKEAALASL